MRCFHCKENQATKTYEKIKGGKKLTEFYCLTCYEKLLSQDEVLVEKTEAETRSSDTCPYCGMTLEEVLEKKLVGCAYCYKMMQDGINPLVIKMQGKEIHKGKTPVLDSIEEENLARLGKSDLTDAEMEEALQRTRLRRQCHELEVILKKLQEDGNFEGAEGYADKLSRMRGNARIEEEFVWRKLSD